MTDGQSWACGEYYQTTDIRPPMAEGESVGDTFQVGVLSSPKPDDQWFAFEGAAIDAARQMAERDANLPVAIWNQRSEIVLLFLNGHRFKLT